MTTAELLIGLGFGLVVVAVVVVVLVIPAWRRSEDQYARWQQRRGDEDHHRPDPPGPGRSHWGGWGRPGR